ncbi:MAG: PqqD family protein [Gemmatimonadetes bacterium]|nr:PqqD family protein [Gemmatimonadota bacterium]
MITPTTSLVRDPALISASLGEEIAMLHVESGRYYFLNGVAAAVWEHLEAPTTPAAVCANLVARYEVSPAQCEAEVLSLLDTLLAREMIRLAQ